MEEIREKLEPITADTAPISLSFRPPQRFMQTDIIVLPIDPHGPIRHLHDRIITSGLPFTRARYTFSPHSTLSLYPSLDAKSIRELLKTRLPEPFVINAIQVTLAIHNLPKAPGAPLNVDPRKIKSRGAHSGCSPG